MLSYSYVDTDIEQPSEYLSRDAVVSINSQGKGDHHMLNQRAQAAWWQTGMSPKGVGISFRWLYPVAKRCLDILVSLVALLCLAPFLGFIAAIILLDSPGPVLHVQKRSGLNGRVFRLYKFRSMTGSDDHLQGHRRFAEAYINGRELPATQNDNGQTLYKPAINGRAITRVGRWLRRTSLDELPQLFNVLKGDMSLVGPRPTMDYETALYTERHRQRLAVLPGLTGWAQVHGRSSLRFDEIVTLDVEYIARRSFWLDVKILLATAPIVLRGEHAG